VRLGGGRYGERERARAIFERFVAALPKVPWVQGGG
jgi:hypothetical protein